MESTDLKDTLTDLLDTFEASEIDFTASALFTDVSTNAKSLQLHTILTKEEFDKATELYSEDELCTLQNIIDVFINSLK